VDLTKGLVCRGRCEDHVCAIIELLETNIKRSRTGLVLTQASRRATLALTMLLVACGLVSLILGRMNADEMFLLVMSIALGVCFLAYGLFRAALAYRIRTVVKESER
jgi:hypothetical protein